MISRRTLLHNAAATSLGFAGFRLVSDFLTSRVIASQRAFTGHFGELIKDRAGLLDLPAGFRYRVISKVGEEMEDGFVVPSNHDGMGAFSGRDGMTLLVRNHEVTGADFKGGAFGADAGMLSTLDMRRVYDAGYGKTPMQGGTTTLVFDTKEQALVRHCLSLACTERNCAGGVTPWDTWISCEETVERKGKHRELDHGYNFEVPATSEMQLADPIPLKAMGRFNHEAVAVDPASGVVYQTEDRHDGVLYRFIPKVPGKLAEGGRLQVLAVRGKQPADLRNWDEVPKKLQDGGSHGVTFAFSMQAKHRVAVGQILEVDWIDIDNVESPDDDLRYRAFKNGAARFARAEGMWYGKQSVFFACTSGGPAGKGQIWRYLPSRFEGKDDEKRFPGRLELFIEPNNAEILQHADNLCVSPWGDLIVCEDGGPVNHVLGVTPKGKVYKLARNAIGDSEFAGSYFSPDGTTLFVNIQKEGLTLAITGPWHG